MTHKSILYVFSKIRTAILVGVFFGFCFSCKNTQVSFQKSFEKSLNSMNIESITQVLNQKLQTYSSYYDASKNEKGYEPMYEAFKQELLKVSCVKEVVFNKGISKSLPPQKSFNFVCIVGGTQVNYNGTIILSEIPRLSNLSDQ